VFMPRCSQRTTKYSPKTIHVISALTLPSAIKIETKPKVVSIISYSVCAQDASKCECARQRRRPSLSDVQSSLPTNDCRRRHAADPVPRNPPSAAAAIACRPVNAYKERLTARRKNIARPVVHNSGFESLQRENRS